MTDAPVPLLLVTGFAGAGKSALVAHLARGLPEEPPWLAFSNDTAVKPLSDKLFGGIANRNIAPAPNGCLHCIGLVPTQVTLTRALRVLRPTIPGGIVLEAGADGHADQVIEALKRPPLGLLTRLTEIVAVLRPHWLENAAPHAQKALRSLCAHADVIIANDWDATSPALQNRCRDYAQTLEKRFFTANFGESDYLPFSA